LFYKYTQSIIQLIIINSDTVKTQITTQNKYDDAAKTVLVTVTIIE